MKIFAPAILALMAGFCAPASAAEWVQYDLYGSGPYDTSDAEAGTWGWGHSKFHATFFVPIGGYGFSQEDPLSPGFWEFTRTNGSNLDFSYETDFCDRVCVEWSVKLNYPTGALSGGFPDKLPYLFGGSFHYHSNSHYNGFHSDGEIWKTTAKLVDAPHIWNITFSLNPALAPEPASWAMMVGGFGLVGGAMRLRRKGAVAFG